jgi:SAM-dependent methyltransferase
MSQHLPTLPARASAPPRILFVGHAGERCGVWQFGDRAFRAIGADPAIDWRRADCAGSDDVAAALAQHAPDAVLFNHHPTTMPWASAGVDCGGIPRIGILHEAHQAAADRFDGGAFDFVLCADPTLVPRNPRVLPVPRIMAEPLLTAPPVPELFTVCSFGFATAGKGFDRLCRLVNEQFDEAVIRLNMPPHDIPGMVTQERLDAIIAACRAAVTKPGIALHITQDFMAEAELLEFLAGATINVFTYDNAPDRGISSCTDYALAVPRPIAVSGSEMFRHLHAVNPSIVVGERTLSQISASGDAVLQPWRDAYAPAAAGAAWNRVILSGLAAWRLARSVPDGRGFNRRLDDAARDAYAPVIARMRASVPQMMTRKIERANIQQAFGLDTAARLLALRPGSRILAVGSFEDTAVATLVQAGLRIEEVDPNVNGQDLEQFYRSARAQAGQYDLILSVSVLEHVADDFGFVRMLGELLAPGGVAVLTVDYSDAYDATQRKPAADQRLYTADRLEELLRQVPDCALLDPPRWRQGEDDFEYEGCRYSFAGFVFRRLPAGALPGPAAAVPRGAPFWQDLLARDQDLMRQDAARHEAAILHMERLRSDLAERLAEAEARIATLEPVAARWERLVHGLRMEDAPFALRTTLPVARQLRRVGALVKGSPGAAAPAGSRDEAPPRPTTRQRVGRAAGKAARMTISPVLAFMLRRFPNLTRELRADVVRRVNGPAPPPEAVAPPAATPAPAASVSPPASADALAMRAMEDAMLTLVLRGGAAARRDSD